jgi:hypothetical protein
VAGVGGLNGIHGEAADGIDGGFDDRLLVTHCDSSH